MARQALGGDTLPDLQDDRLTGDPFAAWLRLHLHARFDASLGEVLPAEWLAALEAAPDTIRRGDGEAG